MKKILLSALTAVMLMMMSALTFGQSPDLGTTANFVLFSTDGAVENTGISQFTGNVGTNNGSNTGFGNVNGGMHAADGVTAQASADLLFAYNQLVATTSEFFPAAELGGGQTLNPGVYEINAASTLVLDLSLDAQGNSDGVFIFKIGGPLSTSAGSEIILLNGAQACNVFWIIEGLVDMASGTTMQGTVIANNAAINISTGSTLEGRALTTAGSITVNGILAYTPAGCGSPVLTGPDAPTLGVVGCYGLFSSDGPVQNAGITNIVGDVGANVGLTTGFDPLLVNGTIHPIPDFSTANAAADLLIAYNYLVALSHDIELLYPAQFGGDLVLTPHTYILNGATTFTDTLYLNAQGVNDAVFIIKIEGALETSSYSNVVLMNGAQAKNVYWMVNGAVDISDYSTFNGTIISQGAINMMTGVEFNGRIITGVGALFTNAIVGNADIDFTLCETINSVDELFYNEIVTIYPNPFSTSINISVDELQNNQYELTLYNALGKVIINTIITEQLTTIETSNIRSGIYFYELTNNNKTIQSGKLILQK